MQAPSKHVRTARDVQAEQFADTWLANGMNGTLAVKQLGLASDKWAHVQASTLLKSPKVRQRIAEKLAHVFSMPVAEPVGLLVQQMRGSVDDLLDENGHITRDRLAEHGALVKKLKTRRVVEGQGEEAEEVEYTEVEMYSSQEAAGKLCRILGLEQKPADTPDPNGNVALTQAITALVRELRQYGVVEVDETAARKLLAGQHPDVIEVEAEPEP